MSSNIMTLLTTHLDQIAFCSQSIADLTFPKPKQFTNALLGQHDITTLIRDTETHERALFSVPPPPPPKAEDPSTKNKRRTTVFQSQRSEGVGEVRAPRRNTAVAAVLGKDMVERIRKGGGGGVGSGIGYVPTYERGSRKEGEVDVEVLLEGAEKLCNV